MRMPSDSELTLLFEGDEQELRQLIENHRETLEHRRILDYVNDMTDKEVFTYVYGVNVDWREDDEEIIRLFGEQLPDEKIEVVRTDKGLDISCNGQQHSIALTFSEADRYITIRGFQKLIKDKYDIRLFEDSYWSDTHTFLILPNQQWEVLEARYPVQTKEIFRVVDNKLDFP